MPGREFSNGSEYRYGFNGKENDNEVKGKGNQQDYGMRIYDPRLGRFLSVDPLTKGYPWNSTYAFAEGDVIRSIDLDGLEKYIVTRLVDNNGAFRGITIQTFTDAVGNIRDNEAYKRNRSLQKADVYIITRNVNTFAQVGAMQYSSNLTAEQQIVYDNFNTQRSVSSMTAQDQAKENRTVPDPKKRRTFDGQRLLDNDDIDGQIVGNKWKDGNYGEATFTAVIPIPVQFPGGSSVPTNTPAAINQLAPIANVLNLFPNSTATVTGNTGNGPGNTDPVGSGLAALNTPAQLDGVSNSTVGATMLARANRVRSILSTTFGINPSRTTPRTGTNSATPAGRNVTVRINGLNL